MAATMLQNTKKGPSACPIPAIPPTNPLRPCPTTRERGSSSDVWHVMPAPSPSCRVGAHHAGGLAGSSHGRGAACCTNPSSPQPPSPSAEDSGQANGEVGRYSWKLRGEVMPSERCNPKPYMGRSAWREADRDLGTKGTEREQRTAQALKDSSGEGEDVLQHRAPFPHSINTKRG